MKLTNQPDHVSRLQMTQPASLITVLLVEDEDAVRTVTRRILERDGFQVLEARSGVEGLAAARNSIAPIDLLITDVQLPDVGGGEVARQIMKVQPQIRVLYLSGYSDEMLVDLGIATAPGTFIQKPFTSDVLRERIRNLLTAP
jgi:two-component system, cell cycle sensor histidine kinase and response regulator CckA